MDEENNFIIDWQEINTTIEWEEANNGVYKKIRVSLITLGDEGERAINALSEAIEKAKESAKMN